VNLPADHNIERRFKLKSFKLFAFDFFQEFRGVGGLERKSAIQHFVEHDTEGIDIALKSELFFLDAFGGPVLEWEIALDYQMAQF
jgi:hypothetical protein